MAWLAQRAVPPGASEPPGEGDGDLHLPAEAAAGGGLGHAEGPSLYAMPWATLGDDQKFDALGLRFSKLEAEARRLEESAIFNFKLTYLNWK